MLTARFGTEHPGLPLALLAAITGSAIHAIYALTWVYWIVGVRVFDLSGNAFWDARQTMISAVPLWQDITFMIGTFAMVGTVALLFRRSKLVLATFATSFIALRVDWILLAATPFDLVQWDGNGMMWMIPEMITAWVIFDMLWQGRLK